MIPRDDFFDVLGNNEKIGSICENMYLDELYRFSNHLNGFLWAISSESNNNSFKRMIARLSIVENWIKYRFDDIYDENYEKLEKFLFNFDFEGFSTVETVLAHVQAIFISSLPYSLIKTFFINDFSKFSSRYAQLFLFEYFSLVPNIEDEDLDYFLYDFVISSCNLIVLSLFFEVARKELFDLGLCINIMKRGFENMETFSAAAKCLSSLLNRDFLMEEKLQILHLTFSPEEALFCLENQISLNSVCEIVEIASFLEDSRYSFVGLAIFLSCEYDFARFSLGFINSFCQICIEDTIHALFYMIYLQNLEIHDDSFLEELIDCVGICSSIDYSVLYQYLNNILEELSINDQQFFCIMLTVEQILMVMKPIPTELTQKILSHLNCYSIDDVDYLLFTNMIKCVSLASNSIEGYESFVITNSLSLFNKNDFSISHNFYSIIKNCSIYSDELLLELIKYDDVNLILSAGILFSRSTNKEIKDYCFDYIIAQSENPKIILEFLTECTMEPQSTLSNTAINYILAIPLEQCLYDIQKPFIRCCFRYRQLDLSSNIVTFINDISMLCVWFESCFEFNMLPSRFLMINSVIQSIYLNIGCTNAFDSCINEFPVVLSYQYKYFSMTHIKDINETCDYAKFLLELMRNEYSLGSVVQIVFEFFHEYFEEIPREIIMDFLGLTPNIAFSRNIDSKLASYHVFHFFNCVFESKMYDEEVHSLSIHNNEFFSIILLNDIDMFIQMLK